MLSLVRALAAAAALAFVIQMGLSDFARTQERAGQLLQSALGAIDQHVLGRLLPAKMQDVVILAEDDQAHRFARSIGILDLGVTHGSETQWFTCTAVVIAPTLVLTNHHCATARDAPGTVSTLAITLGFVRQGTGSTYRLDTVAVEADEKLDYAILRISPQTNRIFPNPLQPITLRSAMANERAFMLHHPRGRPLQLSRHGCTARFRWTLKPSAWLHSCATEHGSSGALLFSAADGAVLGLHYAADRQTPGVGFALSSDVLVAASATLSGLVRTDVARTATEF